MKTLVVEDDFTSRVLLCEFLNPYGAVHVAVDGEEAVAAVRQAYVDRAPYQLICLDIVLPKLDGQGVLKAIREFESSRGIVSSNGAKIVMTTALNDPKNVMKAFEGLCDLYLPKPVNRAQLMKLLMDAKLIS